MSRAMNKVLPVPLPTDEFAHCLVHFPAVEFLLRIEGPLHSAYANVASIADNFKDLALLIAGSSDCASPGDVVIDGVRLVAFRPDIEQHEVTQTHWGRGCGGRLIMRISTVRVHAHIGRVFRHEVFALKR